MYRTITRLCAAAAVATALSAMVPAHAEDWKVAGNFGWFGVGKVQQLEKGHVFWVGEFSGTFFNDRGAGSPFHLAGVRCPASNDLDFNNKKSKAAGRLVARRFQCARNPRVVGTGAVVGGSGPSTTCQSYNCVEPSRPAHTLK